MTHCKTAKRFVHADHSLRLNILSALTVSTFLLLCAGCASLNWAPRSGPLRYTGYTPDVGEFSPVQVGEHLIINPSGQDTAGADSPDDDFRTPQKLKPGDAVTIYLRGPENSDIQDIIDDEGNMVLPNIGRIKLSGLSTAEAEEKIKNAYIDTGIYLRMDVSVISQNQPKREDSFFVYGEAKGPGRYSMGKEMTLLQAISTAGGLTDFANPSRVYLKRGDDITRYNIQSIIRGKDPDVVLNPGDIITVRRKWF